MENENKIKADNETAEDIEFEQVTEQEKSLQPVSLSPVMTLEKFSEKVNILHDFVDKILKEKEDYGVIPGCGNKPTLLKPGAEKLSNFFGLLPKIIELDRQENFETGFFRYMYKVQLYQSHNASLILSEGIGEVNSYESKYRTKAIWENGKKIGSEDKTPAEIAGQINTMMKIAVKRAYVDAVLRATRLSHKFTQDLEDMGGNQDANNDGWFKFGGHEIKFGEFAGQTLNSLTKDELVIYGKSMKESSYKEKFKEYYKWKIAQN